MKNRESSETERMSLRSWEKAENKRRFVAKERDQDAAMATKSVAKGQRMLRGLRE